jgi:hypothetical protein
VPSSSKAVLKLKNFCKGNAGQRQLSFATPTRAMLRRPSVFGGPQQHAGGNIFRGKYTINLTGITDRKQLAQVGAGAWWDFQIRFELWEGTLGFGFGGWHSSFRNEDIPTTYIAYSAAVNGWDFYEAMRQAGGGLASKSGPAESVIFTLGNPSCQSTAMCDSTTPRNNSIYLKVQADDGSWKLLAYNENFPSPLTGPEYFQYEGCFSDAGSNFGCKPIK